MYDVQVILKGCQGGQGGQALTQGGQGGCDEETQVSSVPQAGGGVLV